MTTPAERTFDVAVVGGGPAGIAAARAAAATGSTVCLIESEAIGGACVHAACVPTQIVLSVVTTALHARVLDVVGVLEASAEVRLGRLVARRDALVGQLGQQATSAVRASGSEHIAGRATFESADTLRVHRTDGSVELVTARSFVLATGTRWETPVIDGVAPGSIATPDTLTSMTSPPSSAVVIGDDHTQLGFAVEYAYYLASLGVETTFVTSHPTVLPGLDSDLDAPVRDALAEIGCRVFTSSSVIGDGPRSVRLIAPPGGTPIPAEVLAVIDVRVPSVDGLSIVSAGLPPDAPVLVDDHCRTIVPHIFAAGDVTGSGMLSASAEGMGAVAGANAAGLDLTWSSSSLPRLLHTEPEIGWVGQSEDEAMATGTCSVGWSDMAYSTRATTLGGRGGAVKVIVDELGAIRGVHSIGPGAGEVVALAALAMQSELTIEDLAATRLWHPSMGESLVDAALAAIRSRQTDEPAPLRRWTSDDPSSTVRNTVPVNGTGRGRR